MSTVNTRLHGRSLQFARIGWLVLVILTLSIFFASLPAYIDLLHTPCVGLACGYQQLSPEQAATLEGIGLFPGVFIVFSVTLVFILLVVCLAVSMVIVWRRPDDRMAFIVALFLVTLSPFNVMFNVSASPSPLQLPNECLSFLFATLLPLILALFPGGRFVPRWMRWPVIAFLVVQAPFTFYQSLASLYISAVSIGFLVSIGVCALLVRRSTVPLPASLQPIRAPTDQMGRIWVRCIRHLGCYRNCSVSAAPGCSFARLTLPIGLLSRSRDRDSLHSAFVWICYAAIAAMGD